MSAQLPPNPSINQLRRQGRELLRSFRDGSQEAFSRIAGNFPKLKGANFQSVRDSSFGLRDALLVISREYGFESWPKLQDEVFGRQPKSSPSRLRQRDYHVDVHSEIHRSFADACSKILTEKTRVPMDVLLRHAKKSSLARYYHTLVDETFVIYVPQIRQYVHTGCTFPFFMSHIEGYAAELSFSMPLAFALRDLYTGFELDPEAWREQEEPYEVTEDESEKTCVTIHKYLIKDMLAALAAAWKPYADLEVAKVESEAVPAISRVYYGDPENLENDEGKDAPSWETQTHLADQIVYCEFEVREVIWRSG